jgi:hypothetical protein
VRRKTPKERGDLFVELVRLDHWLDGHDGILVDGSRSVDEMLEKWNANLFFIFGVVE